MFAIYQKNIHRKMKYFTLRELTKSPTADRLKIDNTPDEKTKKNLIELVDTVLDPLRESYGHPIIVTSGYRCPKLNSAVGGVKNSQHVLGQAADIRSVSDSVKDNKAIFDLAVKLMKEGKIKTGQIIDEYGYNWIHISTPGGHVNQILHIK